MCEAPHHSSDRVDTLVFEWMAKGPMTVGPAPKGHIPIAG